MYLCRYHHPSRRNDLDFGDNSALSFVRNQQNCDKKNRKKETL